jgi:hypothetical protein
MAEGPEDGRADHMGQGARLGTVGTITIAAASPPHDHLTELGRDRFRARRAQ